MDPDTSPPLAERMRPTTIKDFIGQDHLLGPGKILTEAIKSKTLFSVIFWGPPGSGKTTLAQIIAQEADATLVKISAVVSNVAEMKRIIAEASEMLRKDGLKTILFIDEIHRFNKAQQDTLLPYVEAGTITLFGATTENPSFEVIGPLLSRSRVLVLKPLGEEDLKKIIHQALTQDCGLGKNRLKIAAEALDFLVEASGGDARFALNSLEIAASLSGKAKTISKEILLEAIQKKLAQYDKKGENHYDTISAFIKSMRAGETDAALHYLARMIEAGEDPMFIARRMVIFASEDIGNAAPTALVLATSAMQAAHLIGMPEATLILAQTVSYLSEAPKSIASTEAISAALRDVRELPLEAIPLHLRNAPTKLMKELGYGKDHIRYPWKKENQEKKLQDYLPKNLVGKKYYHDPKKQGS